MCVKAITGSISENERQLLYTWLSSSADNQKEFDELKSLWNKISISDDISVSEVELRWSKLNYRIAESNIITKGRIRWNEILTQFYKPFFKPAFAVIVLIVLLAINLLEIPESSVSAITISTNSKEKKTVALSDGSTVILNSSTIIVYPKEFSNIRLVNLNGEAFFSVAKSDKQFKVRTNNALVTVLGTKFLIKASDIKTDVVVKEGKVNFKDLSSRRNDVILRSGQRSFVEKNLPPSVPENINPDIALSWTKPALIFNQTSFQNIKSELENTFGIKIVVQKDGINKLTLTGSFESSSSADSVLEMICLALDLQYNKVLDEYSITKK